MVLTRLAQALPFRRIILSSVCKTTSVSLVSLPKLHITCVVLNRAMASSCAISSSHHAVTGNLVREWKTVKNVDQQSLVDKHHVSAKHVGGSTTDLAATISVNENDAGHPPKVKDTSSNSKTPMDLANQLISETASERLEAVQNITTIAAYLGPEKTREQLLPFLQNQYEDDDSVLTELASQLGKIVDHIGGLKYLAEAVFPILTALMCLKDASVRRQAVWSFQTIIWRAADYPELVIEKIQEMAHSTIYDLRISCCDVCGVCLDVGLGKQEEWCEDLIQSYFDLCKDPSGLVRRAAASNLPSIIRVVFREDRRQNPCFPLNKAYQLIDLFCDPYEQEPVRTLMVYALEAICSVDTTTITETALPFIRKLACDANWRVRCAVAEETPSLLSLTKHIPGCETMLADVVRQLFCDIESNVKSSAFAKLPEFLKKCSDPQESAIYVCGSLWVLDFEAENLHVKLALAETLRELPAICNQMVTVDCVLPSIIKLLRDPTPEVRLKVLEAVPNLGAVVDIRHMKEMLIPMLKDLFEERDENWNIRMAIINLVPYLAEKLSIDVLQNMSLWSLVVMSLIDKVFIVRQAAGNTMLRLAKRNDAKWMKKYILPELEKLRCSEKYTLRVDAISRVTELLKSLGLHFCGEELIENFVLSMVNDSVPNVRFNVAKALLSLRLQFPEDRLLNGQSVSKCLGELVRDVDDDVRYYAHAAISRQAGLPSYTLPPLICIPPAVDGY